MKHPNQGRGPLPDRRTPVLNQPHTRISRSGYFALAFGSFLGLTLLKFGNPPIFEKSVAAPANIYEFILGYPWPLKWAFAMIFGLAAWGTIIAVAQIRRGEMALTPSSPKWLLILPLVWVGWQTLATLQSQDRALSGLILLHFFAAVACFYLGASVLPRAGRASFFWFPLIICFALMLAVGLEQRFGGLEATRRYFYTYGYAQTTNLPPEFLKKLNSDRIFGTLFYPNALAGVLLLLTPALLNRIWRIPRTTPGARGLLEVILLAGVLGCLYWSGSKGGWLLAMLLVLIAGLKSAIAPRLKYLMLFTALVAGLAAFGVKYAGFFQKGATSVVARFDYWRAASQVTADYPVFGTGPGTFASEYQKRKRPESEMARLVHNDYLEQASDSGVVGFLAYVGFICGTVVWTGRRTGVWKFRAARDSDTQAASSGSWATFTVWLGIVGWALQSLVEFGLYIPGLAWPAFSLMGYLVGVGFTPPERND